MREVLKLISQEMASIPLDYHFQVNKKSKPTYPYFVGELIPADTNSEDGRKEYTWIVTGFSRSTILDLLESVEKIEKHFPSVEGLCVVNSTCSIVIYTSTTRVLESGAEGLQKTETYLTIKTWKGGN